MGNPEYKVIVIIYVYNIHVADGYVNVRKSVPGIWHVNTKSGSPDASMFVSKACVLLHLL